MTAVKDFIEHMKKASTCDAAAEAVDKLFDTSSPEETVGRLIELSHEIGENRANDEVLGWYVFPGLLRKAEGQDLLPELEKLVKRRNIPNNVLLHIIDLIDKLYRDSHDTYPSHYVDFICDTAANKQMRTKVRARMARLLTRVPAKKQLDTLEDLIATEDMELVEAASHTVSHWSNAKTPRRSEIVTRILDLAEKRTTEAIKQPNVLRTIAKHKKSNSSTVMDALISKSEKGDDWLRLTSCIAPRCNTRQRAEIIEGITDSISAQAEIPVRNLFRNARSRLKSLYREGHYGAFVKAIALDPYRIGPQALSFLAAIEEIKSLDDAGLADRAKKLRQELSTARRNAIYQDSCTLENKEDDPEHASATSTKGIIHCPYYTGFHMGDAIYRNTYMWDPTCHNHWHAAIFQTFGFDSKNSSCHGDMQGIHITGFLLFAEVQTFSARRPFSDPGCNVAKEMRELQKAFLTAFKADKKHPFQGARNTSNMNYAIREEIVLESGRLKDNGIDYTWWDMLHSKGNDWQGNSEDIDNIRCDGVVEYTYEKCGERVCDGTDPNLWNIANQGNQYPENHADLHTHSSGPTPGELCPKVQAGDEGTGSSFTEPPLSGPAVSRFSLSHEGNVIKITFSVTSNEYSLLYVRIIVSKDNGSYDFVITQQNGDSSATPGEWMFMEADANREHHAYWHGATKGGSNNGIQGKSVFRLVAVDRGGNVSAEYARQITIP